MKKQGVSLIVLVITIIVMVVLAGAVILSLNNTGLMKQSQNAVNQYNLKQVEALASSAWGQAFVKGNRTQEDLEKYVLDNLQKHIMNIDNYEVIVTTTGVTVQLSTGKTTLGNLVASALDYGKTVNYEANGVTGWKVFFKQTVDGEEYVYLIATSNVPGSTLPTNIPAATVGSYSNELGWDESIWPEVAPVENEALWLSEWTDNLPAIGTCLLSEKYWTKFKNSKYEEYIKGVVGASTVEMLVKSYNEKIVALKESGTLTLTKGEDRYFAGYLINGSYEVTLKNDDLYANGEGTWLASPTDYNPNNLMGLGADGTINGYSGYYTADNYLGVRPVICLKASIPARLGTQADATQIVLK